MTAVGRNKITIVDIAKKAGVSKSTVSLVLRHSPLTRPDTAEKVRKIIDEVGYVYNRGAANLRKSRTNVVGMVINDLTNPFFAELAVGIERVFHAAGIVPMIANTAEDPIRQGQVFKTMLEQGVAGLIVCPARGTDAAAFRVVAKSGVPTVLAMRQLEGSGLPAVCPDNARGAREATEHLLAHGHNRIAFLGGYKDMAVFGERASGYAQALEANGIKVDRNLVAEGPPSRAGGMACLAQVLEADDAPTAALCFNDVVAFGAILALRQRHIEPGSGFAVIGFDDVVEARHYTPALSTVAVDSFGLGERAAHAILGMIQAGDTWAETYVGPVELIIRQSCGTDAEVAA